MLPDADILPELVIRRVVGHRLPQTQVMSGSLDISRADRKLQDILLKIGWHETRRPHVLLEPQQTVANLHRPARGLEAVPIIVIAGYIRKDRLQVRSLRQRS